MKFCIVLFYLIQLIISVIQASIYVSISTNKVTPTDLPDRLPLLLIFECEFYNHNVKMNNTKFNFTSSSSTLDFIEDFNFGLHFGPAILANDGNLNTVFHSSFPSCIKGNYGALPDYNPTLKITTDDVNVFDKIVLYTNYEGKCEHFYGCDRIVGAILNIYHLSQNSSKLLWTTTITTGAGLYVFSNISFQIPSNVPSKSPSQEITQRPTNIPISAAPVSLNSHKSKNDKRKRNNVMRRHNYKNQKNIEVNLKIDASLKK